MHRRHYLKVLFVHCAFDAHMFVYFYFYLYIYIHVRICTHSYIHIYRHIYIINAYACMCVYIPCIHISPCVWACACAYVEWAACKKILCIYTEATGFCIFQVCVHVCKWRLIYQLIHKSFIFGNIHACRHTCVCIYIYICIHMHTYIYMYAFVCIYTYMYIHILPYIAIYVWHI